MNPSVTITVPGAPALSIKASRPVVDLIVNCCDAFVVMPATCSERVGDVQHPVRKIAHPVVSLLHGLCGSANAPAKTALSRTLAIRDDLSSDTLLGAAERRYGRCFVVFHIEDGVELRDLQQIVNLLGQVQQFDFASLLFGSSEGTDKFADTRAVDIVYFAEVQEDSVLPFGKQVAHRITKSFGTFTQGDSAPKTDDRDAIRLMGADIYAHY